MSQQNPPVDTLGNFSGFGEPIAHFQVGGMQYRLLQFGGIAAILIGIGTLGLISGLAFFANRGPQAREWSALLKGSIFGVGCLVAGVSAWSRSRSYRGLQVMVCTDGLVCLRNDGMQGIRWQDVRAVIRIAGPSGENSSTLEPSVQLIIERNNGTRLVLDETVKNLKELRKLVEEHTLDHLMAAALEQLRDGEAVAFGPATVSREGILAAKALLAWSMYGHGVVERGQVTIYDREHGKAFCKLNTAEVPNAHVLLALAEFFRNSGEAKSIGEVLSSE